MPVGFVARLRHNPSRDPRFLGNFLVARLRSLPRIACRIRKHASGRVRICPPRRSRSQPRAGSSVQPATTMRHEADRPALAIPRRMARGPGVVAYSLRFPGLVTSLAISRTSQLISRASRRVGYETRRKPAEARTNGDLSPARSTYLSLYPTSDSEPLCFHLTGSGAGGARASPPPSHPPSGHRAAIHTPPPSSPIPHRQPAKRFLPGGLSAGPCCLPLPLPPADEGKATPCPPPRSHSGPSLPHAPSNLPCQHGSSGVSLPACGPVGFGRPNTRLEDPPMNSPGRAGGRKSLLWLPGRRFTRGPRARCGNLLPARWPSRTTGGVTAGGT